MSDFDDDDAFVLSSPPSPGLHVDEPDSSSFRYSYEPLREGQIRSIQITSASTRTDSIWLDIETVDLATTAHRKFVAVSYTWGDQTDRVPIRLNGAPYDVGRHCYNALLEISRHYDRDTLIWIDALCINQKDIEEKNQQVQLMADIYRRAREVVSVVGPHADDSALLFRIIRLFHEKNVLVHDEIPRILFDLMPVEDNDPQGGHSQRSRGALALNLELARRASEALKCFSNREYFKRLWIIQELTVAEDVKILCGDSILSLQQIEHFCAYLSFSRFDGLYEEPFALPRIFMQKIRDIGYYAAGRETHYPRGSGQTALRVKLQDDNVRRAIWTLTGVAGTFIRPDFQALPMWRVVMQARDDFRRARLHKRSWYHGDDADVHGIIKRLQRSAEAECTLPYVKLLNEFQDWGCTEVRDMLFGLLSISSFPDWFSKNALPAFDYKKSVLEIATEAIRITDISDTHEQLSLLHRIALVCKAFRLDQDHDDLTRALKHRELLSAGQKVPRNALDIEVDGVWQHKYDIACDRSIRPLWRGSEPDFETTDTILSHINTPGQGALYKVVVGRQARQGDYLMPLMSGCHEVGDYNSIWLVIRYGIDSVWNIIGQAYEPPHWGLMYGKKKMATDLDDLVVGKTARIPGFSDHMETAVGPRRCTADLGDLTYMFCMARKANSLMHKGVPIVSSADLIAGLDWLNHPVCYSPDSTWLM